MRLGVKPPQSDIILTIKVKYIPMENKIGRSLIGLRNRHAVHQPVVYSSLKTHT